MQKPHLTKEERYLITYYYKPMIENMQDIVNYTRAIGRGDPRLSWWKSSIRTIPRRSFDYTLFLLLGIVNRFPIGLMLL
jgi:hypothetical protein